MILMDSKSIGGRQCKTNTFLVKGTGRIGRSTDTAVLLQFKVDMKEFFHFSKKDMLMNIHFF